MLTLLLALGLAAGALGLLWWRTRFPILRRKVLINIRDDTAVRGVLVEARGDWLVVEQGELLIEAGEPAKLGGQTWVPRARVLFLQEHGCACATSVSGKGSPGRPPGGGSARASWTCRAVAHAPACGCRIRRQTTTTTTSIEAHRVSSRLICRVPPCDLSP